MSNRINFPNLTFSYELVNTKDISCKELMQSENLNNNILAALCHIEDEEKYLVEIFDRIFSLEENDREDYLTKLLTILEARPKLKRVLIKLKEENKMLITYTEKMIKKAMTPQNISDTLGLPLDFVIDTLKKNGFEVG